VLKLNVEKTNLTIDPALKTNFALGRRKVIECGILKPWQHKARQQKRTASISESFNNKILLVCPEK
jgi:hypothetical protein